MLGSISRNSTRRFIQRYGKKFDIVTKEDDFDPVTGGVTSTETSAATTGMYVQLPDRFREDGEVKETDKGVYMMDEPPLGCVVKDDGVSYQVVRTVRIGTGAKDVYFLCQLRK